MLGAMSILLKDSDTAVDYSASMHDSEEGEENVDVLDESTQRQDLNDTDKEGENDSGVGEEIVDILDESTQRQDQDDIEEKEDEDENTYPNSPESPESTQPQVNLSDSNCCPSYAFLL